VQGVGPSRPIDHPLKVIAAAVSQLDALLAERHGAWHGAQGESQLAEIAGVDCGVLPLLLGDARLQSRLHRLDCFRQAAEGAQAEGGGVQDKRLNRRGEADGGLRPGTIEEARQRREFRTEGPELPPTESLIPPPDPPEKDLVHHLLLAPSPAAVDDGGV
jgi:hypothetical protein